MYQRLPPLNSLRAFEAAARHLSFKKAAEELKVTPAAIGHQVKGLEQFLSIQLFRRLNRALLLTEAGQACLPELREGFSKLASAVETLRARDSRSVLTATVAPSLAAKWLIPRLHRFRASWPEISVRIDTDLEELDLLQAGIDVGIRFGSGSYPGLRVDRLMGEELLPVCSPKLTESPGSLRTPEDLGNHTLLHIEGETADTAWADWSMWLRAVGCSHVEAIAGPRFTQTIMAVQAAIEGQGVALAPISIVADDIAAGRLVQPFTNIPGYPTTFAYYVVSPREIADTPKVSAFREWVIEEASGRGIPCSG
jgi:LysR family glycine cleavage system transcriptional activator